jgi:hypothetical protein
MCSPLDSFLAKRKVTGRAEQERHMLALFKDVDRKFNDAMAAWQAGGCPPDPKVMEHLAWLDQCHINLFLHLCRDGWDAGEFEWIIEWNSAQRDMDPEGLRDWAMAYGIRYEA